MKIVGLLQVRDGSVRLPGKALADINGMPLLEHVWKRLSAVGTLYECIVSTSKESPEIVGYCMKTGIPHWVGSESDLLSRHLGAAAVTKADAILRVTGDCLFHDPHLLDLMATRFARNPCDIMTNWHDGRTVSEGLDAEFVRVGAMRFLAETKSCPREDWITFMTKSERYRVGHYWAPQELGHDLHLSVDTPEDLDLAREMMKILGSDEYDYSKTVKAYETVQKMRRG